MNKNTQKLVDALRSGEYEQGVGSLSNGAQYCPLGVACALYAQEHKDFTIKRVTFYNEELVAFGGCCTFLPKEVMNWLGFKDEFGKYKGGSITALNDTGATFEEVAALIESKPEGLFK